MVPAIRSRCRSLDVQHRAASGVADRYFSPIEPLLTALQLAAARGGVDVRMLVAGKSDHPILVNVGVRITKSCCVSELRSMSTKPGLNHAKVALIDDDWLMVLWANLDVRSMRLNFELNAPDPGRCNGRQFGASAEGRFQNLQRIVEEEVAQRPRLQRWTESLVRPLASLLECQLLRESPRPGIDITG
jgi:cardiolipin synthase A/B